MIPRYPNTRNQRITCEERIHYPLFDPQDPRHNPNANIVAHDSHNSSLIRSEPSSPVKSTARSDTSAGKSIRRVRSSWALLTKTVRSKRTFAGTKPATHLSGIDCTTDGPFPNETFIPAPKDGSKIAEPGAVDVPLPPLDYLNPQYPISLPPMGDSFSNEFSRLKINTLGHDRPISMIGHGSQSCVSPVPTEPIVSTPKNCFEIAHAPVGTTRSDERQPVSLKTTMDSGNIHIAQPDQVESKTQAQGIKLGSIFSQEDYDCSRKSQIAKPPSHNITHSPVYISKASYENNKPLTSVKPSISRPSHHLAPGYNSDQTAPAHPSTPIESFVNLPDNPRQNTKIEGFTAGDIERVKITGLKHLRRSSISQLNAQGKEPRSSVSEADTESDSTFGYPLYQCTRKEDTRPAAFDDRLISWLSSVGEFQGGVNAFDLREMTGSHPAFIPINISTSQASLTRNGSTHSDGASDVVIDPTNSDSKPVSEYSFDLAGLFNSSSSQLQRLPGRSNIRHIEANTLTSEQSTKLPPLVRPIKQIEDKISILDLEAPVQSETLKDQESGNNKKSIDYPSYCETGRPRSRNPSHNSQSEERRLGDLVGNMRVSSEGSESGFGDSNESDPLSTSTFATTISSPTPSVGMVFGRHRKPENVDQERKVSPGAY